MHYHKMGHQETGAPPFRAAGTPAASAAWQAPTAQAAGPALQCPSAGMKLASGGRDLWGESDQSDLAPQGVELVERRLLGPSPTLVVQHRSLLVIGSATGEHM